MKKPLVARFLRAYSLATVSVLPAGLHRGPLDRGVHLRRHDAHPVVALRRPQPPGARAQVDTRHAGAGHDRDAVQEHHQAGADQHHT